MSEARWKTILPCLDEFQRHLAQEIPKLQIIAANDSQWTGSQYQEQKATGIFNAYGVYLIFAPDESLEYVGIAMNRFDDRIWSHETWVDRRWTDLIPLTHSHYFLAPALEFFLISRLQPPKNKIYRSYTVPTPVSAIRTPSEGAKGLIGHELIQPP